VAVIVAGPIIDAIGVRRTFRITGAWFLVWSAVAAVAPTMPMLIGARAMQGIGGGLVMSVALAAVGLTYPPELRPRAFAANSLVWGVLGFGGPALAGLLLAVADWRAIFVVQLPITGVALVVGWNALPGATQEGVRAPFDPAGIALLTALTVGSLVAVSEIGDRWDVFGLGVAVSAVTGAMYWVHAGRAATPVVARRHITLFPAAGIHAVVAVVLIAGLALDNYLPIYVQVNRGHSESLAAFTLAFLAVGWTSGSLFYSRRLTAVRPAAVMRAGAAVLAAGCAAAAVTLAGQWPLATVFVAYTIVGLGIGTVSTPALTWLQGATEPAEMGRVTSAHQFLRQLAITYGVAAGGAVLLLVVGRQVDDIDEVRDALSGDDVELGAGAAAAIGDGLAAVALVSTGLGLVAVAVATVVLRRAARQASDAS
jgi:predicted MFS family arabinose efflux permease